MTLRRDTCRLIQASRGETDTFRLIFLPKKAAATVRTEAPLGIIRRCVPFQGPVGYKMQILFGTSGITNIVAMPGPTLFAMAVDYISDPVRCLKDNTAT